MKLAIDNEDDLLNLLEVKLKELYNIDFKITTKNNIINILTNEFPTGTGKKTYSNCIFIENVNDKYVISENFKMHLENKDFKNIVLELIDFGLNRYNNIYKNRYMNTSFVLYEKYTYEDVCRLLEWEKGEVALNIGGRERFCFQCNFPLCHDSRCRKRKNCHLLRCG